MKQIQKCPYCKFDAIFSHSICPNCGRESKFEDRLEPDYKLEDNKGVPSYVAAMEEEMTTAQRHGAILLGTVLGLFGLPPVCIFLTNIFLLMDPNRTEPVPIFKSFLLCVVLGWAFWELWQGRNWLRLVLVVLGWLCGLGTLATALHQTWLMTTGGQSHPLILLGSALCACMYIWAAWHLRRSRDIPEFLRYQRERAKDAEAE